MAERSRSEEGEAGVRSLRDDERVSGAGGRGAEPGGAGRAGRRRAKSPGGALREAGGVPRSPAPGLRGAVAGVSALRRGVAAP